MRKNVDTMQVLSANDAGVVDEIATVTPPTDMTVKQKVVVDVTETDDLNVLVGNVAVTADIAAIITEAIPTTDVPDADMDAPEAAVPVTDVCDEQTTVVTEVIQSENQAILVGEETTTTDEVVASDETTTETDTADAYADADATMSAEFTADEPVTSDSDILEPERVTTSEEIQEAREATGEMDWDDETRSTMENTTLQEVTPLIMGELSKGAESDIRIGLSLARSVDAVADKSFRIWVTKVLKMDAKRAYELRSIGKFCSPLLQSHQVTFSYLSSLGISKLTSILRFPEPHRRLDANGHFLLSEDINEKLAENMTNEEIRQTLQKAKETTEDKYSTLVVLLNEIEGRCILAIDIEAEVKPMKSHLMMQIPAWHADLESKAKLKEKTIEKLRKSIKSVEMEKQQIEYNTRKANWWIELLEGRLHELPEGVSENVARQIEEEANRERILAGQARTEKSLARR